MKLNWAKSNFCAKTLKECKTFFMFPNEKFKSNKSSEIKTVRGQGTTRNLEWELHGIPNQLDEKMKNIDNCKQELWID